MSSVLDVLRRVNNGRNLEDVEKNLAEALIATSNFGGKSTVYIEIQTELAESSVDNRGTNRFDVSIKSHVKPAKKTLPATSIYVDRELRMSTRDPNQLSMDDLAKPKNPARQVLDGMNGKDNERSEDA